MNCAYAFAAAACLRSRQSMFKINMLSYDIPMYVFK